MTLRLHDTATKACVGLHVHDGTTKDAVRASIRTGGSVVRFFGSESGSSSSYSVTSSTDEVDGHGYSAGTVTVVTPSVTAIVEGAIGAVTYSWAKIAGAGSWTITQPSQATTAFSVACARATAMQTATFRCTATDSAGQTGTVDVVATCVNDYYGGELP